MSGVSFGSSASLRQLGTVSTPQELCDLLGGKRVIKKVIDDHYFIDYLIFSFRFLLLTMVLPQLNVCVQFDVGPTKCFVKNMQLNLLLWLHQKICKQMLVCLNYFVVFTDYFFFRIYPICRSLC